MITTVLDHYCTWSLLYLITTVLDQLFLLKCTQTIACGYSIDHLFLLRKVTFDENLSEIFEIELHIGIWSKICGQGMFVTSCNPWCPNFLELLKCHLLSNWFLEGKIEKREKFFRKVKLSLGSVYCQKNTVVYAFDLLTEDPLVPDEGTTSSGRVVRGVTHIPGQQSWDHI